MKTNTIFRGVATALVTPLTENGIDYENFERLIRWQITQGINALVICGTSGEGSTLSDEEHRQALKFAYDVAGGSVPMIAGTGSNDTAYAVSLTQYACELGYDAMLVVTPYYNKATQNGLVKMFETIADASTCEVNPIPVKAAVSAMGFCKNYVRLPLTPMEEAHRQVLLDCMRAQGLDV